MGSGSSSGSKYVLRLADDGSLPESPSKMRSKKGTIIYPMDQEGTDNIDVKAKQLSRRNSKPIITTEDGVGLSPKKAASIARMNSKLNISSKSAFDSKDTKELNTPASSGKGMLIHSPSRSQTSSPTLLAAQQPSQARMTRSGSVMSKNSTTCSQTYPWLLKNTNTAGSSLNDFELGRVIGKNIIILCRFILFFCSNISSNFTYSSYFIYIGRGLMGTVRIAKNKSGKYLVFKAVRKDYVMKHNDMRHIQNEKDILRSLNNSFCVKLFGTFQDRTNIYYALEYCPGGELFQHLGRKKTFSIEEAKFYLSEVFVALEHVQELGYVYRDLKPENIILDEEGHCKLVDFGFSTPCSDNITKLHTLCGTPAYLSPEQLDGKFTNGYTRVVDWWSYGVLIYELLTGKTPFCRSNKDSHYEIFLRILNKRISFPWGFDSTSKELVSKLCHAKIDQRLCSAPDIKQHGFFTMPWSEVSARRLVPPFVPRIKEEGDIHYFKSYAAPLVPKDNGADDQGYGYFDF